MSNLVEPILNQISIADCHRLIKEAHRYLSQHGMEAIEKARQAGGSTYWGAWLSALTSCCPMKTAPNSFLRR